jgi:hypothetical protein
MSRNLSSPSPVQFLAIFISRFLVFRGPDIRDGNGHQFLALFRNRSLSQGGFVESHKRLHGMGRMHLEIPHLAYILEVVHGASS